MIQLLLPQHSGAGSGDKSLFHLDKCVVVAQCVVECFMG